MATRILLLFIFLPIITFAQHNNPVWGKTLLARTTQIKEFPDLQLPASAQFYHASFDKLNSILKAVNRSGEVTISLPIGENGAEVKLAVLYDPIMSPGDRLKFSDIKTYAVHAIDNRPIVGRIGISKEGFYGIFDMDRRQVIIRHATDRDLYAVYNLNEKLAMMESEFLPGCGTETIASEMTHLTEISTRNEERRMRHFTIAISCTSGFAEKVGNTENQVMAKVVETLNLLNHRYNIDFGIRLDLMDNTSRLFNLNPQSDYFYNQTVGLDLLQQNQDFLDSLVDNSLYDLAQVFTKTCKDVGGVVWGRACNNEDKARGVSCRSNDEDYFFTTFKHEVGHQFSGGHTFNSCNGSTQYNPYSCFEPGAGSTILSYGNNCGSDNVGERVDYFHVGNIIEITGYAAELENTCGSWGPDINHDPRATVLSPREKTIPIRTPFELEGSATDIDNDNLTYNWEQYDLGHGEPLGTNFDSGPLFVSVLPNSSGTRLFPNLSILNSGDSSIKERLPVVSRELNFRMTVRDNVPLIGGHDIVAYKFNSSDQAGPFLITFPTAFSDTSFLTGQYAEITWDVANTNQPPVNCDKVNIIFSSTDGLTWSDTLVANTPNDGREYVMMPRTTGRARFKVKAADNIFLDLTRKSFKIKQPQTPGYSLDMFPHDVTMCKSSIASVDVRSISWKGFSQVVELEVLETGTSGISVYPSKAEFLPGEPVSVNIEVNDENLVGVYQIKFMAISAGSDTLYRTVNVTIADDAQIISEITSPANKDQNVTVNPTFSWKLTPNSFGYQFQLSQTPDFSDLIADQFGISNKVSNITDLSEGNIYYWRVRSLGNCGYGRWSETQIFRTQSSQGSNEILVINKELLKVRTNESRSVNHSDLFCQSQNNQTEILSYLILKNPKHGFLSLEGTPLNVGDHFTQQNIDDGTLRYNANEPGYEGPDGFDFLAFDHTNSFAGPETYDIDINQSNPSSVHTTSIDKVIEVLPNPSSGIVQLSYRGKETLKDVQIRVMDMKGRVVMPKIIASQLHTLTLNLSSLSSGTYIIMVESGNYIAKKRLVKI